MKASWLALLLALLLCAPGCSEQEITYAEVGSWIEPGAGVMYRVEGATQDADGRVTVAITMRATGDMPFALSLERFVLMDEQTNAAYWPECAAQRESGWLMGAEGVEIPAGMMLALDWTFAADKSVTSYQLVYLGAPGGAFYATPLSFAKPTPAPAPTPTPRPMPTYNPAPTYKPAPVPIRTPCFACKGSKVCAQCDGTGTVRMYGQSGECTACGWDRKCTICGGLGYYEHWQ